jgi:hypothetical protein
MHLKLEPWTMDPAGPKTFTKQQLKPIKTDLQQSAGLLPFQNSRTWLWMTSAQNDITDVSYHGKAVLQHRERARQVLTWCLLLEKWKPTHHSSIVIFKLLLFPQILLVRPAIKERQWQLQKQHTQNSKYQHQQQETLQLGHCNSRALVGDRAGLHKFENAAQSRP